MPHYLQIGLTAKEFFHSTPRILRAYDKAYEENEKHRDYLDWRLGNYVFHALSISLSNLFRQKGTKPDDYLEAPYHELKRQQDIAAGIIELSEEEKEFYRQKLFGKLEGMQKSFEAAHKNQ